MAAILTEEGGAGVMVGWSKAMQVRPANREVCGTEGNKYENVALIRKSWLTSQFLLGPEVVSWAILVMLSNSLDHLW